MSPRGRETGERSERGDGSPEAVIFTIPIVALVGYPTVSRVDVPQDQRELGGAGQLAVEPLA